MTMEGEPSTEAPTPGNNENVSLGIPPGRFPQAQKLPRSKKRTKYITEKQAMNLIEALYFAEQIGLRLNVSIDINWLMFSGFVDDKRRWAKCQERISKWSQRHGFPLTMIWVRETGRRNARLTPMFSCTSHHGSWKTASSKRRLNAR
jgi:hypothetical protein